MHKCKFCKKEFESGIKLGGHTVWCKKNPKAKESAKKISEKNKGDKNPAANPKVKKKISETIKEKVKNGNWHLSFSKSRTHLYKNIKFHGKWELNFAKYLDKNNIEWRRPNEKFLYIFEDKKRYYTPDFFIIKDNLYIEIKGYPVKKDFAKWDYFPLKLKIINGKDLVNLGLISEYKSKNIEYKNYSWK